jgi:signal transduction histidine kinase
VQWLPGVGAAARLPDGRWLLGAFEDPDRGPLHFLLALTATFGTMALGCYPLARRITRRLEGVRHAADSFGAGRLSARAPVEGRDEVADLARAFNAAAEHVERLVDGQRTALASASHELRSPLARVRMAVALLDDDDPERHRVATEAERDIAELDALIGDLLLASRLDGRPLDRTEPVDLLALVAEEAARLGDVEVAGPAVTVRGDPKTLRRLVRNLLENARRYGGGAVDATLSDVQGTARLDVADRGPGVPEGDRERIFEPFYRPATHREAEGGVGLGLSLVRTIATAHGGTVRYQPREGGGSVFRVELARA